MFVKDKKGFTIGFLAGFCAGFVSRELIPGLGNMIKPASKTLFRAGISAVEKIREMMAKAKEEIEDLTAEVFSELEEDHRNNGNNGSKKNPKNKSEIPHEG